MSSSPPPPPKKNYDKRFFTGDILQVRYFLQVPIKGNYNKAGIGSIEADFPSIELDSNTEKKQIMWRKTQERYKEIKD